MLTRIRHAGPGLPTAVRSLSRGRRVWAHALAFAVAGSALAGCGSDADPSMPPAIVYGEDVCAQCGMIISDARFASAMWVQGDRGPESLIFDDIGDLLAYEEANPGLQVLARYVHDYDTEEWIRADSAVYVSSRDIQSPMGHGLAAFYDAESAALHVATADGKALTFDELATERMPHDRPDPYP